MKTIGRLQFRHFSETFESREAAYKYLSDIVDATKGDDYRLDESRIGEPILVKYKDENGNIQALLSIGLEGEKDEGVLSPYHIIDSAKLEEEIQSISGSTGDIDQKLIKEIARAIAEEEALHSEIDATQTGAGLEDDGSYVPESTATYVSDATSLKDADTKLDEELARVEKARKDVTGQDTDEYVPNVSLTTRPIAYISDAESLNDADVKLDEAIQVLANETLKNVVVDGISGVVTENIAVISISADTIPIGPFEEYTGRATTPHPIHDDYSVLEAIKQVDTNFIEFVGTVNGKVQELSGNVQTLSAETKAFSASAVSEITRLDEKIDAEIERAEAIDEALQKELDTTQTGAGLNSDGTYKSHDSQSEGMAYITTATSIDNATVLLDKGIQAETGRATLAEQSISGIVNTFSAATEAFSATTVAEIARVDGRIDSSNTNLSELSASTKTFSAATVSEITRLDTKINNETTRATAAEDSISGTVDTFSAATEAFSAATVSEIARLDALSTRNKVKSAGNTIVVAEATEGTNLETNIDNKTILSNNGELKTGLKVAPLAPSELQSNVREAFRLVDNEGTPVDSTIIKIYKSSSLVSVQLINVDGIDYVRITYIDNEGVTQTMDLNIQKLIFEAEFKDGLVVNENGEVRVKIDPASEVFLTVSSEGIKVSGLQNAINTAVAAEAARATAAEDSISANVTTLSSTTETFSAATIAEIARIDGRIDSSNTSLSELSASTIAFSSATVAEIARLDSDIDNETARATAAENSISANVTTLSSATEAFSAGTVAKFELMESGWNVPGSIKHTIEDAFIKSVAVGSSEDSNKTLMRYYNDGDEHKYYVSSNASDMYYNGLPLSTVIKNIEDENTQSSKAIDELSAATISEVARLDGRIDDETTRATAAENSISGTVNTLSAATESEIERIEGKLSDNERVTSEAINQLKDELDRTEDGAGLNDDGTYHKHNTAGDMGNYITNANSLDEADMLLDSALKAESDRAIAAEESISGIVNTFSAATESTIRGLQKQLTEANSIIETLRTEIQTLSGVVETIESQMAGNIYSTVRAMLQGASRQIKVTPDDANKQINIGFADDAIFGQ